MCHGWKGRTIEGCTATATASRKCGMQRACIPVARAHTGPKREISCATGWKSSPPKTLSSSWQQQAARVATCRWCPSNQHLALLQRWCPFSGLVRQTTCWAAAWTFCPVSRRSWTSPTRTAQMSLATRTLCKPQSRQCDRTEDLWEMPQLKDFLMKTLEQGQSMTHTALQLLEWGSWAGGVEYVKREFHMAKDRPEPAAFKMVRCAMPKWKRSVVTRMLRTTTKVWPCHKQRGKVGQRCGANRGQHEGGSAAKMEPLETRLLLFQTLVEIFLKWLRTSVVSKVLTLTHTSILTSTLSKVNALEQTVNH